MTVQPYDFGKPERTGGGQPLPSDLERDLAGWLGDSCALAGRSWGRHFPFRVELKCGRIDALRATDALERLPEGAVVYRFPVHTETNFTALALPRPVALALAAGLLGESVEQLAADRELTAVEESLCEYLIQDFLLAALRETWTGRESLLIGATQKIANPRWARLFPPSESVVRCALLLGGPFGDHECWWLLSLGGLLQQFGQAKSGQESAGPGSPSPLEKVAHEIRVELCVLLGNVRVSLAQLAQLRPGDMVILDQRVAEPLSVHISGVQKFKGWPGRVGSRQALQIESSPNE